MPRAPFGGGPPSSPPGPPGPPGPKPRPPGPPGPPGPKPRPPGPPGPPGPIWGGRLSISYCSSFRISLSCFATLASSLSISACCLELRSSCPIMNGGMTAPTLNIGAPPRPCIWPLPCAPPFFEAFPPLFGGASWPWPRPSRSGGCARAESVTAEIITPAASVFQAINFIVVTPEFDFVAFRPATRIFIPYEIIKPFRIDGSIRSYLFARRTEFEVEKRNGRAFRPAAFRNRHDLSNDAANQPFKASPFRSIAGQRGGPALDRHAGRPSAEPAA
ncbi:hypothetical protein GC170_11565 [bacterium]|nr:hypothetical protein [bacterium]